MKHKYIVIRDEHSKLFGHRFLNSQLSLYLGSVQLFFCLWALIQHIWSMASLREILHCDFSSNSSLPPLLTHVDAIIFDIGLFHNLWGISGCVAQHLDGGYGRFCWCVAHSAALLFCLPLAFASRPKPQWLWPLLIQQSAYGIGMLILSLAALPRAAHFLGDLSNAPLRAILFYSLGTLMNFFLLYVYWHWYWHVETLWNSARKLRRGETFKGSTIKRPIRRCSLLTARGKVPLLEGMTMGEKEKRIGKEGIGGGGTERTAPERRANLANGDTMREEAGGRKEGEKQQRDGNEEEGDGGGGERGAGREGKGERDRGAGRTGEAGREGKGERDRGAGREGEAKGEIGILHRRKVVERGHGAVTHRLTLMKHSIGCEASELEKWRTHRRKSHRESASSSDDSLSLASTTASSGAPTTPPQQKLPEEKQIGSRKPPPPAPSPADDNPTRGNRFFFNCHHRPSSPNEFALSPRVRHLRQGGSRHVQHNEQTKYCQSQMHHKKHSLLSSTRASVCSSVKATQIGTTKRRGSDGTDDGALIEAEAQRESVHPRGWSSTARSSTTSWSSTNKPQLCHHAPILCHSQWHSSEAAWPWANVRNGKRRPLGGPISSLPLTERGLDEQWGSAWSTTWSDSPALSVQRINSAGEVKIVSPTPPPPAAALFSSSPLGMFSLSTLFASPLEHRI